MKLILLTFLLFCFTVNGQRAIEKKIDSIIDVSIDQFVSIKFKESLETTNNALTLSNIHNYPKGTTTANIYIARILLEMGVYNRSLIYLEEAEEQPYFSKDFFMQSELYRIRGRIYENLKMGSLSIKEFRKQLKVSDKIADQKRKYISQFWAHQNMAHVFERQKVGDSVIFHVDKMENLLKNFKIKEELYLFTSTYIKVADLALKQNDLVKTEIYLKKSIQLLDHYQSNLRYDVLKVYGDLENVKGHINNAAHYYEQALNNALELDAVDHAKYLAKTLADYYHFNGLDPVKTNNYLLQYHNLNDSLDTENKEATETLVTQILNKEQQETTNQQMNFLYLTTILIILSLGVIGYLIFKFNRNKKRYIYKNKLLVKNESRANHMVQISDMNVFNELIRLAKNNNPEFLILFKERYPHFVAKLKELDPKVRSSELTFCAMAYLNFSTKDIAEYTYVTIRAVQIRKNRLRKKYGIPSDLDFNSWIRKLAN